MHSVELTSPRSPGQNDKPQDTSGKPYDDRRGFWDRSDEAFPSTADKPPSVNPDDQSAAGQVGKHVSKRNSRQKVEHNAQRFSRIDAVSPYWPVRIGGKPGRCLKAHAASRDSYLWTHYSTYLVPGCGKKLHCPLYHCRLANTGFTRDEKPQDPPS